jgi:hypothetical protein
MYAHLFSLLHVPAAIYSPLFLYSWRETKAWE